MKRIRFDPQAKPFLVVYSDSAGRVLPFGYSESSNGGSAMFLARLVPWARNPRVFARLQRHRWDRTETYSAMESLGRKQKRAAND